MYFDDSDVRPKAGRARHPSVMEKEKQIKFVLELYPHLNYMQVHNILAGHRFNADAAAQELLLTCRPTKTLESYEVWRQQFVNTPNYAPNKTIKKRKLHESQDESEETQILRYFQSATLNELQLMNHCSRKKGEFVLSCRPFINWLDLVNKLKSNKSFELLGSAQCLLATRRNIQSLMKKCWNLSLQINRAFSSCQGVKQQPSLLSNSLKLTSYQLTGYNWLTLLHEQGVNGILADEMGLGKTVQVIAFLAGLKDQRMNCSTTSLIIVPSSTLDNWQKELNKYCPQLRVFVYYGSTEDRKAFRVSINRKMSLKDFDVILTTYSIVANSPEERRFFCKTLLFHYVIFDEAHLLKNMNTQRFDHLIRINGQHRLLLTGTPLQNNLLELFSLLIFVMPQMFARKSGDLKNLFRKLAKNKQDLNTLPEFERQQIKRAKRIMNPFILRRLKAQVLHDLPRKIDEIVVVKMGKMQQHFYDDLLKEFKLNGNCLNGITMFSELRKLSNHPLLLRKHFQLNDLQEIARLLSECDYKDSNIQVIVEDLTYMSDFDIHCLCGKFDCLKRFCLEEQVLLASGKFAFLDGLLSHLLERHHRVLLFSQYVIMLNLLEEYMKLRNYSYLRLDGGTPVTLRQSLIEDFSNDSSIFVFLLSTKAGGLGINLTAADTVIIHDIDFNPYNDKQAEDRCHRIGQKKTVTVYRLISEGTIEENMLNLNLEKLKLERDITAGLQ